MNEHVAILTGEEDVANQTFEAVISKENRLISREVTIEFSVTQPARIDFRTTQLQKIENVNEANLQVWEGVMQQVDCSEAFHIWLGPGSSNDNIRFNTIIIGSPINPFQASIGQNSCFINTVKLWPRLLGSDQHINRVL